MKKFILFLSFCGLFIGSVSAAAVHLKDGRTLNGTVVSATARDVQIQTSDGLQKVDADQIQRIDYAGEEEAPRFASPRRPRAVYEDESSHEPERQMMSFGVGFSNPLSRINFSAAGGGSGDNGDTGFLLGTQYTYFLNSRLGAGFDLSFANRSRTGSQSLLPSANTDVYGNSLLLLATLRYSLTDRGRARPFFLAGVGTNRTSTLVDVTPNEGFAWSDTDTGETRTLVDETRWGLATTARFGVDFLLSDPALFTIELGWTGLSNSDYTATAAGKDLGLEKVNGNLDLLTVVARWGWRF